MISRQKRPERFFKNLGRWFLYRTLLGSIRVLDHSIIRVYQGDGAAAWKALRAVYAGAGSTRSGLISSLDSLKSLVSVQMSLIRSNTLIQNISALELLDVIQLATVIQMLSSKRSSNAVQDRDLRTCTEKRWV